MADSYVDVSDFAFRALQKVRVCDPPSTPNPATNRLAVSSQYQVGVAASSSTLTCFSLADVHSRVANKNNMNEIGTDLPRKTVAIDMPAATIQSVQFNSQGSLLAVLCSSPNGVFVLIYDALALSTKYTGEVYRIGTVRLGNEAGGVGRVIEWNPVLPEVLIAASSDSTLCTVKLDLKTPTSFTVLGEKKMPNPIAAISWSPKGKQVTVGDDKGNVVQMKPELDDDIVRTTAVPSDCSLSPSSPRVSGLCWLSTTEWLVAFGAQAKNEQDVRLLTLKKNEPASWRALPDLSYGNGNAAAAAGLSVASLLEWEVIVVASAKTSEAVLVGKRDGAWKVWGMEEESRIDLPTDGCQKETFPVGVAVDRSAAGEVVLGDHRTGPCPIVCVLSSDGVLLSFHAVSGVQAHAPATSAPLPIDVSAARPGRRPEGMSAPAPAAPAGGGGGEGLFAAAATPAAAPTGGLFGGGASGAAGFSFGGAAKTAAAGAATPEKPHQPLTASFSFGGAAAKAAEQSPSVSLSTALAGAATPSTPATLPTPQTPVAAGTLATPALNTITPTPAVIDEAAVKEKAEKERKEKEEREKKEAEEKRAREEREKAAREQAEKEKAAAAARLVAQRKECEAMRVKVSSEWRSWGEEWQRMLVGLGRVGPAVRDMESRMSASWKDCEYVSREMARLRLEAEEDAGEVERALADAASRCGELRAAMEEDEEGGEGEGGVEKAMRDMQNKRHYDRDVRMCRVEERVAGMTEKMAEAEKMMEEMRMESLRPCLPPPSTNAMADRATEQTMRNIQRIYGEMRRRVDGAEKAVGHAAGESLPTSRLEGSIAPVSTVNVPRSEKKSGGGEEKMVKVEDRERLRSMLRARQSGLKPRRVEGEEKGMERKEGETVNRVDADVLAEKMGKVLNSPRPAPSTPKADMATQSDPIEEKVIIKEVIREVPSPVAARPSAPSSTAVPAKPSFGGVGGGGLGKPAPGPAVSSPLAMGGGMKVPLFGGPKSAGPADEKTEEKKNESKGVLGGKSLADVIGAPLSFSTPKPDKPASSLFGGATAKATPTDTTPTAKKEEGEKNKDATPTTTGGLFGAKTGGGSVFGKTTGGGGLFGQTAATATPAATEEKKEEEKKDEPATVKEEEKKDEKKDLDSSAASDSSAVTGTTASPGSVFGASAGSATSKASTASSGSSLFGTTTANSDAAQTPTTTSSPFGGGAKPAESGGSSIFGGDKKDEGVKPSATPSSIFGGAAAKPADAPTTVASSIFGGGGATTAAKSAESAAATSSIFGGGASKPATAAATGSIFGGSSSTPAAAPAASSSPFGAAFGAASAATKPAGSSIFGGGSAASSTGAASFSFKAKEAAAPAAPAAGGPAAFSFAPKQPAAVGGFAAAAAAAATDEGMDEEMGAGGAGGGGMFGGGGFMSGMGSAPSQNAGKNPFGSATAAKPASNSSSWLFSGGNKSGGGASTGFGAAAASAAASTPAPSFGGSPAFGGAPKFGGGPAFGAKPSFGSPSSFGGAPAAQPQQTSSVFGGGGGAAGGGGGGFAAFAGKSSFGGGSQQPQQQQQSSVFGGGSAFGGGGAGAGGNSVFGGGANKGANFTSWR